MYAYPDPTADGVRVVAWADLAPARAAVLRTLPAAPPDAWPAPTRTDTTVWDGTFQQFPACNRVRLDDGVLAAWRADAEAVTVAAFDPTGTLSPPALVDVLAAAVGCQVVQPASYQHHWLRVNLHDLGVDAPDDEPTASLAAGLAHLLGYRDVTRFLHDPMHNPTPLTAGGAPLWRRALPADRRPLQPLARAIASHEVTGGYRKETPGSVVNVTRARAVLSQRLRRAAGVPAGVGKGEVGDEKAGLARYVFFHLAPYWPQMPDVFIWTDAMKVLGWVGTKVFREDPAWFPIPFQADIRKDWRDLLVTDLREVAELVAQGAVPQVAVPGALPLTGYTTPDAMIVTDPWTQQRVVTEFERAGVTTLNGVPLSDAIRLDPMYLDLDLDLAA